MSKMTCAEHPFRRCKRALAHVKKKKQDCDVCGKSQVAVVRGRRHTPKRKSKEMTCAERSSSPSQEGTGTRQKEKERL